MPGLPESLAIDASGRRVALSPRDPAFVADPYPAYRAIRTACPIFVWEDLGHWCAAAHGDVDALFRDRRLVREPPEGLDQVAGPFARLDRLAMLEREPPAHTRLRRLVGRAFVSRALADLAPVIAAMAEALVAAFPAEGAFDLLPAFATPIPVRMIARLIGVAETDAPRLLAWSHAMVAMYRPGRTAEIERAADAAAEAFSAYLGAKMAARRSAPRDDLLGLIAAAVPDDLSEEEAVANAVLLLNAGHEATVHALGNGVAAILASGQAPAPLFATPERTAATVEEVLRFDPPLHLFTRFAREEIRLGDIVLRPGERIGLLIGAANRDPALWSDPDRFDPLRSPHPHVAFGGGLHFCLGAALARMELGIALRCLFTRRPNLRLAALPRVADTYHFRGYEALWVEG